MSIPEPPAPDPSPASATVDPDDRITNRTEISPSNDANGPSQQTIHIVSVSDSESYLKWAAQLLSALPGVTAHVYLVDSPILPTAEQIANAVADTAWEGATIPIVSRTDLGAVIAEHRPDIVLGAATGPIVAQLFLTASRLDPRPALVSGLPGMGLPASTKGMNYRRLMDAFIAHSATEVGAYTAASALAQVPCQVLLSRLPMLRSADIPQRPSPHELAEAPRSLVFAPQAKVPRAQPDREAIIAALADFAERHPTSSVIVKMRSRPGEHETHREQYSYFSIIESLQARGVRGADRIEIGYGPLGTFLQPGSALVTVSSTAALESIDRSIPTLIISDFGFDQQLLNEVYADSGATGSLGDVAAGAIGFPSDDWMSENYFHEADGSLRRNLGLLALRARENQLPRRRKAVMKQKRLLIRAELRTVSPTPVVNAYRKLRYGR